MKRGCTLSPSNSEMVILYVAFGRGGWLKNVQFKPVKATIQLVYPSYDTVVPNSLDQVPWKEEELVEVPGKNKDEDSSKEGAKGKDLNKTASIESLIGALAKDETQSPKTDRKLVQEEVQYFQKRGSFDG